MNIFFLGAEWGPSDNDNKNHEFDSSDGVLYELGATNKRSGSYSYLIKSGSWFKKDILPALSECYYQFWLKAKTIGASNTNVFQFRYGTAVVLRCIWIASTKKLTFYAGSIISITYLLGALTTLFDQVGDAALIEVYYKVADSGGRLVVRVNQNVTPEIDFTGDTKAGSYSSFNNLYASGGSSFEFYLDDMVLNSPAGNNNNSWPDGGKVVFLPVKSDEGPNELVPTPTGSHYAVLDEVPSVETDYLKAESGYELKIEALGAFADMPGPDEYFVDAVRPSAVFKRDSTSQWGAYFGLRKGGVDFIKENPKLALLTTVQEYSDLWELDPVDDSIWTTFKVNAISALLLKSVVSSGGGDAD
jgi:hypothetical protein